MIRVKVNLGDNYARIHVPQHLIKKEIKSINFTEPFAFLRTLPE